MNKEFVPYEEALALKGLGFNEPCFGNYYSGDKGLIPYRGYPNEGDEDTNFSTTKNEGLSEMWVTAPLYQQVFRWFRNKYDLRVSFPSKSPICFEYFIATSNSIFKNSTFDNDEAFKEQEETELACLKKLIELIKK